MPKSSSRSGQIRWLAVALLLLLAAGGSACYFYYQSLQRQRPSFVHVASNEPIEDQVHHFCGGCHAYPPAETFPKRHWKEEVERGYQFFQRGGINLRAPPIDDVVKYYVDRAPEELPTIVATPATHPLPVRFEPIAIPGPALPKSYAVLKNNGPGDNLSKSSVFNKADVGPPGAPLCVRRSSGSDQGDSAHVYTRIIRFPPNSRRPSAATSDAGTAPRCFRPRSGR